MQNFHKVIIVGAGPLGLYFASKCDSAKIDYLLLEGDESIGGQLTRLYPEKEIVDIPGMESIKAKDFISLLSSKVSPEKIITKSLVKNIKNGEIIEISTEKTTYFCEKLIIATGLGTPKPRPLGVEGETECENIFYSIDSFDHLANKRVAIFGGGDSALDWSKAISNISDYVHLIHRRTEFRGNPDTIKNCKNLHIHLPYIPHSLKIENNKATEIVIKKVSDADEFLTIPVDYIFVNYGNVASFSSFPLKMKEAFILVDENQVSEKNIFAIGDVSQYDGKIRRIAPGMKEADKVFALIC